MLTLLLNLGFFGGHYDTSWANHKLCFSCGCLVGAMLQAKTSHHLAEFSMHAEISSCLCMVCGPLRETVASVEGGCHLFGFFSPLRKYVAQA